MSSKRSKRDEQYKRDTAWMLPVAEFLFFIFSVLICLPFLPVAISYYYWLRRTYLLPGAVRVNNIENLKESAAKAIRWSGFIFIVAVCIAMIINGTTGLTPLKNINKNSNEILLITAAMLIWYNIIVARWLSIVYFGVIVDGARDRLYFRQDQQSYDILDYVTLKFFRDLEKIDSVKISEIGRMSRQYGDNLYIAGEFGSRKVWFTTKQKRDECIYAIEHSGKLSGELVWENEFYNT